MTTPRLHIVGLPYCELDSEQDGFSLKVRNLVRMFPDCVLYAGENNPTEAKEFVTCITKKERKAMFGEYDWWKEGAYYNVTWDADTPHWTAFALRVMAELSMRLDPQDIIMLPVGVSCSRIIEGYNHYLCVEAGIGYPSLHPATHKIYESYAWMHAVRGSAEGGIWFDDVIYPSFVTEQPPTPPGDYFVFASRMIPAKGYQLAIDTCKELDKELVIIGTGGDRPEGATYTGLISIAERDKIIAGARGLFCPTIYTEPFGYVIGEALINGVPVISTDWGSFPEIIEQGVDGYRCHIMKDFIEAADNVINLDRNVIRERANARFSPDVIKVKHEAYFDRLLTLFGDGFYTK